MHHTFLFLHLNAILCAAALHNAAECVLHFSHRKGAREAAAAAADTRRHFTSLSVFLE